MEGNKCVIQYVIHNILNKLWDIPVYLSSQYDSEGYTMNVQFPFVLKVM